MLGILAGMKPIEERYRARRQRHDLSIVAAHGALTPDTLRALAGPCASKLRQIVIQQGEADASDTITLCLVHVDQSAVDALASRLRQHESVVSIEIINR